MCHLYGGIAHPDGKTCCADTCGAYCGAINCFKAPPGEYACCDSAISKTAVCSKTQRAPCIIQPCAVFNGIFSANGSFCCPHSCGVSCGECPTAGKDSDPCCADSLRENEWCLPGVQHAPCKVQVAMPLPQAPAKPAKLGKIKWYVFPPIICCIGLCCFVCGRHSHGDDVGSRPERRDIGPKDTARRNEEEPLVAPPRLQARGPGALAAEGCPVCGATYQKGDTFCGFCGTKRVMAPLTAVQVVTESNAYGSRSVVRTPERAEMENWLSSVQGRSKSPEEFEARLLANSRR